MQWLLDGQAKNIPTTDMPNQKMSLMHLQAFSNRLHYLEMFLDLQENGKKEKMGNEKERPKLNRMIF